ncbi:restriction endonuclease [Actinacidiphila sp. DG2A-62]|uniref:restriction endonuclease n=1 Tax=Actinacidiphila sp. DG2A-62 TaxID=3108821 RepID=UPI002DC04370|nr:restriction endonuclease [Actinacidiphila sp. DG2A-62]MEC3994905.1 restriction endonuclease [Actinacidiphila sp. DG2A-62]
MSRRQPARRRRTRKKNNDALILALLVAVVAIALVVTVVSWLFSHVWILVLLLLLAGAAGGAWGYQRVQQTRWEAVRAQGLRYALSQLDTLHHRQFEHAVRDLMRRDGCRDAVQVGGAGDNGADVKATDPFGRRWVIQCKHRRDGNRGSAVGTPDLHVLNGTARQLHGADVVVLVTNGRFSANCRPLAKSQRLHLVDRRLLGMWASGSQPIWEVLRELPPPRKASTLS